MISTNAPLAGGDIIGRYWPNVKGISTNAPLAGGDHKARVLAQCYH